MRRQINQASFLAGRYSGWISLQKLIKAFMHVSNTNQQVSRPLGSEYCLDHITGAPYTKCTYLRGNRIRYRTTRPISQRGARYMFQFQGSLDWPWKQRRKESSTIAAAASCTKELISNRSRLCATRNPSSHASLGCNHSPFRQDAAVASANHIACLLLTNARLSASI